MDKNLYDTTQTLVDKIAKVAGLSNDISLLEGKMGIAILLFQSSKYFSSEDLDKVAEFLIDDIIEEKKKLYDLCVNRSSEIFWALNYLSDSNFLELDKDFFDDIDDLLFRDVEDLSKISVANYPFLGNYLLSRYGTSNCPDYWILQIKTYLLNMMKIIISNKGLYRRNTNLLAPFWYTMLTFKEKEFDLELDNDDLREVCLFFVEVCSALPDCEKRDTWFQFYRLYNNLEFKYNPLDVNTISDINAICLSKLIYANFIMPPNIQAIETISGIVNDKNILKELNNLISYQNVGISGYISGFAWTLLQYLQPINKP